MQAIILAAGMGRRLKKLTENQPKCMVTVNGIPMIERMRETAGPLPFEPDHTCYPAIRAKSFNPLYPLFLFPLRLHTLIIRVYRTTNNIYSLYLAKDQLLMDDTILLESDLIFEQEVLTQIISDPYPNLALCGPF